ncbi:MAG TPA: carbamoyltransferase [Gemmataceae bacterium]|jgi:carbamoyltransferase|nr:carbamoyltransferase [Gemmataceae bacterium]
MTAILGISAFYHDSAAALVVDGDIVAAVQEERFSRIKHDPAFPAQAVAYCLKEAGLDPAQLDYIVFYEKPFAKLERLLETYLTFAPHGLRSFCQAMPGWLKNKLWPAKTIQRGLPGPTRAPLIFTDHHESHAASAFYPSPFETAAILTLDGVGEWSTTAMGMGRGNRIELTHHLQFPHSLGLLYSAFTSYCGFQVNSGEYKLMGLAPYGQPVYRDLILNHLIDLKPDGSFWLNMAYFNYCQGLTMTNRRFERLFGGPPRRAEADLEQRHMNLAASIQAVTEEIVVRLARGLHQRTGAKNLVMAGGVALNCVANGRLLREGLFDDLWIQPAAGDAGGALGAALFVWHQLLERPREPLDGDRQRGSLLGPRFSSATVRRLLIGVGERYRAFGDEGELMHHVASLLAKEKVVGWFQGRMEFGPRALGGRSILGDPRSERMQSVMNVKIKFRESFRPFAPSVLREHAGDWFDLPARYESPYMLLVAHVLNDQRVSLSAQQQQTLAEDPDLRKRVGIVRSTVPAITHVDYSARLQTVDKERQPRFHALLEAFYDQTGCPMLVNTSFNVRGEPIVCTPEDAYRCFLATDMDVLVMEDCVVEKQAGTQEFAAVRERHLARFAAD